MVDRHTGQRVTFGPAEWLGVAGIICTILLTGWRLSVNSETRFTRLETKVETLSDEVNRLRDAQGKPLSQAESIRQNDT